MMDSVLNMIEEAQNTIWPGRKVDENPNHVGTIRGIVVIPGGQVTTTEIGTMTVRCLGPVRNAGNDRPLFPTWKGL
jgi:hypothetical protein